LDRIGFSHEPEILGTGGAIAHAAHNLASEPFLVLNSDAMMAPPIAEAVSFHRKHNYIATMVLARSEIRPNVRVDGTRVTAILRGKHDPRAFTFTGFHVVSQELLVLLPRSIFHDIRDTYDSLLKESRLGAFVWHAEEAPPFLDIGTPETYLQAHQICSKEGCRRFGFAPAESRIRFADGFGCADRTAIIGKGSRIEESVVLAGARVAPGARILRSIIGPGATAQGEVVDRLVTTRGERKIGS
jgi:mannose-1-phosphate guanylyltransferase